MSIIPHLPQWVLRAAAQDLWTEPIIYGSTDLGTILFVDHMTPQLHCTYCDSRLEIIVSDVDNAAACHTCREIYTVVPVVPTQPCGLYVDRALAATRDPRRIMQDHPVKRARRRTLCEHNTLAIRRARR